ncbi:MAG: TVP38/TMEM64 family protein [Candidatus Liptonbacteria bacterium]|nr:TVP38/TMEM64 family protein [Candidatus Liptonbacteria bacterium]
MKYAKLYTAEIVVVGFLIALFVIAGYYSSVYEEFLIHSIGQYGIFGMALYVVGALIAEIIPSIVFLPLVPVAVTLWGSFLAAVLSIIAWTLGSAIIFLLVRRYGHPLVARLLGEEKLKTVVKMLPRHHIFLGVILMRIALPVDLVSYALGLFNIMSFKAYLAATFIGIVPFAFAFSYFSDTDVLFQISAFVSGVILFALIIPVLIRQYRKYF